MALEDLCVVHDPAERAVGLQRSPHPVLEKALFSDSSRSAALVPMQFFPNVTGCAQEHGRRAVADQAAN